MGRNQNVFCREELKYMLGGTQYEELLALLGTRIVPDKFYISRIVSVYYDTPDHLLIRRSLEKSKYKEKLRLRCYGVPDENSEAFVEIKKKVKGVVYKRRESLPYKQAVDFLSGSGQGGSSQIFRELDWFLKFYGDLQPTMFLSYDRQSYKGTDDGSVRITFDKDILWRTESLDARSGIWGTPLFAPDRRLMEVKIRGAMPLWLSHILAQIKAYPHSISKYGLAYQTWVRQEMCKGEERRYA